MKKRLIILLSLILTAIPFLYSLDQFLQMPLPQDERLVSGDLENGFRYFIKANNQPSDRAELRLIVNIGAIDEDEDQLGLAHFTEHMVFKGTKNYTKQEMINYLNSIGLGFGGGLNAFTSMENTVYTLSAPTKNKDQLEKAFEILSELAFHAVFDDDELEEERGVIIEEWRMYQGASQRIRDRIQSFVLSGSRYGERTPIGSYDIIKNFERDTILRFYNDWYRPDMMTLLVVGDIETDEIESFIEKYFNVELKQENLREREYFEVPDHPEPRAIVAIDDEMAYTTVSILWTHDPIKVKTIQDLLERIVINLASDMLSTRLEELTHQPDIDFSYGRVSHGSLSMTKSQFSINAFSPEEKVLDTLTHLLKEAERVNRYGFTFSEMQRAVSRVRSRLERQVSDMDNELSNRLTWSYLWRIIGNQTLLSPYTELEIFNAIIELVSVYDLNEKFASLMTEENFVITVRGPEKEGLTYPSEEELIAVRKIVREMEMDPYLEEDTSMSFMEDLPAGGEIVKKIHYEDIGITFWKLSNGIEIFTKKTDFKNDEILFSAISPGGYSLYPPEDRVHAQNASSLVIHSGFGDLDKVTIDRILSGSLISFSASIGLEEEGFRGHFSPRDSELLFQKLFQYSTNPRKCHQSFQSYLQREISFYENMQLNPERVFIDSVMVTVTQNNPYSRPSTIDDLRRLSHDRALEIYNDRFADFSDFTFFFVGNFDEEEFEEFFQIYLASLPSLNRGEAPRDVRSDPPAGRIRKIINVGRDDKSMVYALNPGKAEFSLEEAVHLDALETLVQEALRINVREKRSGVYAVQIMTSLNRKSHGTYMVSTVMYCSPERYDELIDAIYETLDSIKNGNITEEDLTYSKSTMLRNLESQKVSNRYHLNQMERDFINELKLGSYREIRGIIERIDIDTLIQTADRFFTHQENLIEMIRLPRE